MLLQVFKEVDVGTSIIFRLNHCSYFLLIVNYMYMRYVEHIFLEKNL